MHSLNIKFVQNYNFASSAPQRISIVNQTLSGCTFSEVPQNYIKENNNHLIKNNYKTTFSLPQKVRLIQKQLIKCACGHDFIICLTKELKPYCYFQSAVHNVEFKDSQKIVDIAISENFVLFLSQKGELFGTEFMAEKLVSDSLKPKLIKLNFGGLGLKDKFIEKIKIIDELIFLHMKNNLITYLKRNDWMETKSFTDPEIINASKNLDISDIVATKLNIYFLTKQGKIYATPKNQLNLGMEQLEIKETMKKIITNQSQVYGISEQGFIVKINIKNGKAKCEKVSKLSTPFVNLAIGNQNYYAITSEQQAWVWGKNAYGQLGLSDYQPRSSLYPLVSMEKFYIKQIFSGDNYVCCLVDDTRVRQSNKVSQKSSVRSPIKQVKAMISQNQQFNEYRDSFNQTEEFLMPIRYTEDQSKHSQCTDQNESVSEVNIIVNKKKIPSKNKDNVFKKTNTKTHKSPRLSLNPSHQRSTSRPKIQSKVSNHKCADNSCSRSKGKSAVSQSKLTPKSSKRQKSFFKDDKQRRSQYYVSTISDTGKSNTKSQKKQRIVSFKSPFKSQQDIEKTLRQKICKEIQAQFEIQLENRQKQEDQKILNLKILYGKQKQILLEKIHRAESQFKSKAEQNRDLFDLVTHKNLIIEDITKKIKLLEEAIEQHQKTLTARDNQAQEYFLRQKQYQLHIQKLESQVQKLMDVLNYNERNRQAEVYKKEIDRLSTEIKQRIESEKQYYKQRMLSMQRKFEQEKNIYELEIRALQDQLNLSKKRQSDLIARMKLQKGEFASIQLSMNYPQTLSDKHLQSPTFHTLDIKEKIKNKMDQNFAMAQSQLTLHDHVQQRETLPLKESNRKDIYFSPLQKNQNQVKTRKNSRNISQNEQSENYLNDKSDSQVKQILEKIQMNKTCISKSANKLFNILQSNKMSENEQGLSIKF